MLLNEKKLSETFFIFNSDLKLTNLKGIKIKALKHENILISIILQIYFLLKIKFICLINGLSGIDVWGQDHIDGGSYFRAFHNFYLLEDGIANYEKNLELEKIKIKKLEKNYFRKIIRRFLLKDFDYGLSKRIKRIYLTGLLEIPKDISSKVEIIDLKLLWERKNLNQKKEILNIFSFDSLILKKIESRDIILFTQPLSEDGIITEKEKIEIYSKIIQNYSTDRLVIKTHPRETTSYKKIFENHLVLDNAFPFELLRLLDIKFNKAVTIFSTAAFGLGKDIEVDFYGTEVHPKILERCGSYDTSIKRNVKL